MKPEDRKPVSVVLVGIGGMGLYYVDALLEEFSPAEVELCAAVDPFPEKSDRFLELKRRGIPVFPSLEDCCQRGLSADLAVIASPIHYHVPQSCAALLHGSHVLCEKPLGATIQEAERLILSRDKARRWVMIGYQWSYSEAIQSMKRDILKGLFGKPIRLKAFHLWGRDKAYYERNSWAGKKQDEAGHWVLDSPANGAMAHDLHNLFYVLGERITASARPKEVKAELYRAYPIENYDSIACRSFTEKGVELLFYASHAVPQDWGPLFSFEFEQATVSYREFSDGIVATFPDKTQRFYGSPESDHQFRKLFDAVAAVKEPKPVLCGPEAAVSQTLCVNGIQESVAEIETFTEPMIQKGRKGKCWVKGLSEAFYGCYEQGILPSEAGLSWARCGRTVDLGNYRFFPGGIALEKERKR